MNMGEMTLQEFLDINGRNRVKGFGYEEIDVYDRQNNSLTSWAENDPKYQANIVRIHPINEKVVKITIKYKENKNERIDLS